jgi:AcrR family transcriptional regulator
LYALSMATPLEPRLPLTRNRILQAALALGDAGGIESLTMRKLSQVLGFGVMSLYNHVAGKDDVLDGMLDRVLAECEPPSPTQAWDNAIRASAISVHDALRRHTWSTTLLMAPEHTRPAQFQYMELLLQRLHEAGFSADTTFHAYHVLDGYIFGFSLWETSHAYTAAEASDLIAQFEQTITADEYPHLRRHGEQHFSEGPHRERRAFEFGLDLILASLENELPTV